MTFLPVAPGVRHSPDTGKGASSQAHPRSKAQTDKTLQRDDYTCRFCGFHSKHYQRVIANPDTRDRQEWVTACTFCEQCLNLDRAGVTGAGILIWLPEIGQAELNHIARAIYVARAEPNDLSETATRALDALTSRRAEAKKRLGSDDPLLLATVMQEMLTADDVAKTAAKIEGIRLLPPDKHLMRTPSGDVNQFPQIVKYWRSPEGPYAKLPVESWVEMFKTAAAKTGHG